MAGYDGTHHGARSGTRSSSRWPAPGRSTVSFTGLGPSWSSSRTMSSEMRPIVLAARTGRVGLALALADAGAKLGHADGTAIGPADGHACDVALEAYLHGHADLALAFRSTSCRQRSTRRRRFFGASMQRGRERR